jgi:hypothetical protein
MIAAHGARGPGARGREHSSATITILLSPGLRKVAIAMARSGGHQLSDAIVRSVALVAGAGVEVVRQSSTHAPIYVDETAARRGRSPSPEVWVGRAVIAASPVPGYRGGWNR